MSAPEHYDEHTFSENPEVTTPLQVPEEVRTDISPIPVLPQLGVALGMLALVFGITYVGGSEKPAEGTDSMVRVEKRLPDDMRIAERPSGTFEDLHLQAQSVIVWDVATQRVLFNKNADEARPIASVTKLMTALVAYELLDPDATVTITDEAIRTEGDSGLLSGETFTVQNLTYLKIIESSNDGATALAIKAGNSVMPQADGGSVFVSAMNLKADELGLTNTRFHNSTGLDLSETEAGAYGSARDMAHLMEYLITKHPDAAALTTLDATTIYDTSGKYHVVKNTNEVAGNIDGLIASKTGYTLLSGGNLVIAVNLGLNRPVVIAVLGSSTQGRFTDALALLEEARVAVEQEI